MSRTDVARRGPGSRWSLFAWALFGLIVLAVVVGLGFEELSGGDPEEGVAEGLLLLVGFLSFPAVGALIVSRQPRNGFGWVLLMIGCLLGAGAPTETWADVSFLQRSHPLPLATFAAWIQSWFWYPLIMSITTLLLQLFPDGRLPSRRWRPLLWATTGLMVVVTVMAMLQRELAGHGYRLDNPIGVMPFDSAEDVVPFWVLFPFMLLSAASLVVRYRRSRGVERQQLKWVVVAGLAFAILLVLGDTLDLPDIIFPFALMLLPGAIGIAVLRYRLYDVDLIINKTLVYGLLTLLLSVLYVGLVALFQQVLSPVIGDSQVAVAASTLAVAALFRPARSRIQGLIDHVFYRRKYDATRTIDGFAARLRDEVDLDTLTAELLDVVHRTMQPRQVSLWLRPAHAPDSAAAPGT
ncbi:MAG: hypothetical protein ABR575_03965 [Actinomycetota bacterium]